MKIKTIPKGYIINMINSDHGKTESNFLLHGLSIKNDSDKAVTLRGISFELYASDNLVKQISYIGKALELAVSKFAGECTWLGEGIGAGLFLGEEGFFHPKDYSSSVLLEPNRETGLFNEYFVVIYSEKLDSLKIRVIYDLEGNEYTEELDLPLIQYQNKNDYSFPLKGCYSTCGNYTYLLDHRQHYSMEFAIDMAQYNEAQKLKFREPMQTEDYVINGREILAIADGEVVDCYNDFPFTTSWIWEDRKPFIDQYGFYAAQCGNHVVIKHANSEYSFYGHMMMGSVAVKNFDKVKQGQVIGKVGHTGLSNCPHLHFQLMDGPDFLTARGLPCYFTNLEDVSGYPIPLINENNLTVHTK
jgi:hypothetical protein